MGRDWSEYKLSLISSGDLKYSMVTIIENIVLYLKFVKGKLKSSHHTKKVTI